VGAARRVLAGIAAGAVGTTALNTVTYLDMAARARPASETPEQTIEKLTDATGLDVPGDEDERANRVAGLGPLLGIATGLGVGALLGVARALGWRPRPVVEIVAATVVAAVGANAPMAALGISDPRSWSAQDWAADLVPHLAYGVVTAATLQGLDRRR
jgi:hypothetical protein